MQNFFNDSTLSDSGSVSGFAETLDLPPSTQDLNEEFKNISGEGRTFTRTEPVQVPAGPVPVKVTTYVPAES